MSGRLVQLSERLGIHENRIKEMREKYPLDRQELNNLIFTPKYAHIKKQALKIISQNQHIFKHADVEDMGREEQREKAMHMILAFQQNRRNNIVDPINFSQDPHAMAITAHVTYNFDPGFSVKNDIHYFLYYKTIYSFHTSQLHREIMQKALRMEHIGCFGLTQLGHGSNARNVLTECIYDHKAKQFVVNTPHKLGMKFWIGAAAQLATMSVIWAQLVIDGKSYGPHPFIVPLRDPATHQSYQGVTIGDCGPKNGCNNIDNGFIMFKDHRIPKGYLLDKLSGVDEDGNFFAKIENPQKRFGNFMAPLSYGRSFVALNSIAGATASLAISIRYCHVRRQFSGPTQSEQKLIIDYPSMKNRLMPLLAQSVVYYLGGAKILRTYDERMKDILDPKNKIIEEMHALSAVLKVKASSFLSEVVTQSREACGGHGYSSLSRLGRLYHDQDINLTWQGDNSMLLQQSTKYILKASRKLNQGKSFEENSLYFINDSIELPENISREDLRKLDLLYIIMKKRVVDSLQEMMGAMMTLKGEGLQDIQVWNKTQAHYGKNLSYAFGDLYYFKQAMRAIQQSSQEMAPVLTMCLRLWIMSTLEQDRWADINEINELCQSVSLRSISILDSIAQPSQVIGSVFADENGEGMKKYFNAIITGKTTFKFYDWQEQIPFMREARFAKDAHKKDENKKSKESSVKN